MSMVIKLAALGVSLMFSVWACANNNGIDPTERCKHEGSKIVSAKVIVGNDRTKKPRVDPTNPIIACFEDDIAFTGENEDDGNAKVGFEILFKGDSPFDRNINSGDLDGSNGEATGKVKTKPRKRQVVFEYDVKVEGYPVLDPRIIITPR